MAKYLFFILVILLSGCTVDFSGLEKPEESVYIRFISAVDIQTDVIEATRNGNIAQGQSVGVLGLATTEDLMDEMALDGYNECLLHQWMANDVYYRNIEGDIVHSEGKIPAFPINKGSAITAYAYMPHSERIVYGEDGCCIPLDLIADSATTDWMCSGKIAKSKDEYRVDRIFRFDFDHAMTRLDLVLTPRINKFDKSFEIMEVALGLCNHGKGKLFIEDGTVEMDTASYISGSIHQLQRKLNRMLSIYNDINAHTESFYLMPYTKIHDLRIVGIWNGMDTVTYEYIIADSLRWDSNNLRPGTRSIINVSSIGNER